MKVNTKSSVTLPRETLSMVKKLRRQLGAKSNVEVVRQGLYLLNEKVDREALKNAYRQAATTLKSATEQELAELDHLAAEALDM
jgi:Arc/MetJ-type ribon-helix-helix transcriptional regulator